MAANGNGNDDFLGVPESILAEYPDDENKFKIESLSCSFQPGFQVGPNHAI
jgi:hypothetical protein